MNDTLEVLYQNRFAPELQVQKDTIWKTLVDHFFQKFIKREDRVLDIACGYGEFINHIECKEKYGIDLNTDSKKKLNKDVNFFQGNAVSLNVFTDEQFNVVFTSNFLEHLKDKESVKELLINAKRVLKKDGRIFILGPNIKYVPGSYWDFWDHHVPLTDQSLCEVLDMVGFKIELNIPRFLPYTTKTRVPKNSFFVKMYLKNPWIWPIMGKQFFVVAKKE